MRVLPHVQEARSTLRLAVIADRLGNGENVRFSESAVERRPTVSACSKRNQLVGIFEIRLAVKVFPLQSLQIHKHFPWSGFSGQG